MGKNLVCQWGQTWVEGMGDEMRKGRPTGIVEGLGIVSRSKGSQCSVLSSFLWALSPMRRTHVRSGSRGPAKWPGGGRTRGLQLSSAFCLLCLPALLLGGNGKWHRQMWQILVQSVVLGPQKPSHSGHSQPPAHYPYVKPLTLPSCIPDAASRKVPAGCLITRSCWALIDQGLCSLSAVLIRLKSSSFTMSCF